MGGSHSGSSRQSCFDPRPDAQCNIPLNCASPHPFPWLQAGSARRLMSATEALPAYYGAYGARRPRTVTPVGRTLLSSTGGYGSYGAYGARRLHTATPVGRTLLSSTGGYGSYGAYGSVRN